MAALNSRFIPKKMPRTDSSTIALGASSPRRVETCGARVEVREVVVLEGEGVSWRARERQWWSVKCEW